MRLVPIAVAALSAAVLALTGYGWTQVQLIDARLTTTNVIDPPDTPADTPTKAENILLVGLDSRTDAHGNPLPQAVLDQLHAGTSTDGGDNTDTMIVIHIPAGGGAATALSIPRDSYVPIAGGFGTHKINSAYTYGKNAAATALREQGVSGPQLELAADEQGARTAIQTVQQLTGLTITHYAAVNLVGFSDISTAVGGVPVCLNAPVDDPLSGADLPAGPQTVSGAQALEFVRQRHGLPNGDLDRIRRQQAFLASLTHTVLTGGVLTDPTRLDALVSAVQSAVTIDQGWDLLRFAEQMQNLSAGAVTFRTVPVVSIALRTPDDGDAVEVNPQQVQAFVAAIDSDTSNDSGNDSGSGNRSGLTPTAAPTSAPSSAAGSTGSPADAAGAPLLSASGVTCVN